MCTGIRLLAKNGAPIYARTLEFGRDIQSDIVMIPRNSAFAGTAPDNTQGLCWKTTYAVVGASAAHQIGIIDGINEHGLAGGLFYFPNYAQYQDVTQHEYAQTLAPWELLTFLLSTCATLSDVKKVLPTIKIANILFASWSIIPPLHTIIHDPAGNSIVIEYIKGKLVTYDNPLGVITNAPNFDWHITNLNNYLSLTALNSPNVTVAGITLTPLGQGSGMLGIPGDFTSPSRFVRAVAYSQAVIDLNDESSTLDTAFHILSLFNIPRGVICQQEESTLHYDYTQWTAACDLRNKRYYYHTYGNQQLHSIDLMNMNLDAKEVVILPMHSLPVIIDDTPR